MNLKRISKSSPLIAAFGLIFFLTACNGTEDKSRPSPKERMEAEQKLKEDLIRQNRELVLEELEQIDSYIERHRIDSIQKTSTGLVIRMYKRTGGRNARLMNNVMVSYKASLPDGTLCYDSDSLGVLDFTLGQSNEPSGLQEAILKMREGEEAMLIVPSYLAYGITGDGICIPGGTSVIFRIKLEKVSD